ncbi:MAG: 16S rRNA (cytosine(1402)-N(4))-methyltransferase RsmH [Spirochaetaceae bacterium]|nr:MAG: 16S rRNA (cytosine(1402)-N(4))-methyltransferase RsmH [Spirochaetaceae bacterium]
MAVEHDPVLLRPVEDLFLPLQPGSVLCDATLGAGGHTARFLELCTTCSIVGIDADTRMLDQARRRLGATKRVEFVHGWFDEVLANRRGFDRILIDLGISMVHLREGNRGFSFLEDGPLDMRLDATGPDETAEELIQQWSESEIADTIYRYGEERYSRRIAAAIVRERPGGIRTTGALAEIIRRAVPPPYRRGRIHPATRTFQALRIAVNRELERLERVIPRAARALNPGGRLAIISFHSLEDRIVKHRFRDLCGSVSSTTGEKEPILESGDRFRIVTRKPIVPDESETRENPASRSAKLRVLEKAEKG